MTGFSKSFLASFFASFFTSFLLFSVISMWGLSAILLFSFFSMELETVVSFLTAFTCFSVSKEFDASWAVVQTLPFEVTLFGGFSGGSV